MSLTTRKKNDWILTEVHKKRKIVKNFLKNKIIQKFDTTLQTFLWENCFNRKGLRQKNRGRFRTSIFNSVMLHINFMGNNASNKTSSDLWFQRQCHDTAFREREQRNFRYTYIQPLIIVDNRWIFEQGVFNWMTQFLRRPSAHTMCDTVVDTNVRLLLSVGRNFVEFYAICNEPIYKIRTACKRIDTLLFLTALQSILDMPEFFACSHPKCLWRFSSNPRLKSSFAGYVNRVWRRSHIVFRRRYLRLRFVRPPTHANPTVIPARTKSITT